MRDTLLRKIVTSTRTAAFGPRLPRSAAAEEPPRSAGARGTLGRRFQRQLEPTAGGLDARLAEALWRARGVLRRLGILRTSAVAAKVEWMCAVVDAELFGFRPEQERTLRRVERVLFRKGAVLDAVRARPRPSGRRLSQCQIPSDRRADDSHSV